ncbi:lipase secretion chaperone [Scleromatobacter humisilvae]|uniref:Lipase chaperone n=1 Tax=Scleromatobacter humisilvae TaxID=2897159 RepID=A0A9X2BXT3_9BURK|nr:lipase secretion chaperone [Scleromatobacter humisilvae]MCK9684918.1 lipase chaperone [Scleromatobacter humisilvae]
MTWVAGVVAAAALVAVGLQGLPVAAPRAAAPAPAAEAPPAVVSSLAGTTPDGAATATADDALVLDPALIRLFDYWLTTVGERPIDAIRAQVEHDLDGRLAPHAARQAKDLFARYVRFKTALKSQRPPAPAGRSVDTLRDGLRMMLALRAGYFSEAESQALFGPQDAEASAALARMAIEQDPSLTDAQRRERLAALDARLPADVRAAREAPLAVVHLEEAAQRIRAQGGSEDDVYRMRAAATSPEAANRLADVDRDEAAWKARIAAYLAQRSTLLSAPGGDDQHAAAMSDLRNRLFTPEEQRRLAAYEG